MRPRPKAIAAHGGQAAGARRPVRSARRAGAGAQRVIEFDSYEAARAYYYSAEYQAAKALREGAAEIEMVLCGWSRASRPVRRLTGQGMGELRIVVAGAAGRMGRMIVRAIHEADGHDALGRARARELAVRSARMPAPLAGCPASGLVDRRPIRCRCS